MRLSKGEKVISESAENINNTQIVIFGTGAILDNFLELYGDKYPPSFLIDNDKEKWGTEQSGYEIKEPESLLTIPTDNLQLIICCENYQEIEKQLQHLKIQQYFIYVFDRECIQKKPYNIGYIAGVFDLFHVGHLNLLHKAKEKCEHLIVGVLTDDLVMHFKNITPHIPEDERRAILEAVRFVDQVVFVTIENIDKLTAWELYHFDCLFSGDDWKDEPSWNEDKLRLNQLGSNIEFFSYTKGTSSTQIRKLIQKSLN